MSTRSKKLDRLAAVIRARQQERVLAQYPPLQPPYALYPQEIVEPVERSWWSRVRGWFA